MTNEEEVLKKIEEVVKIGKWFNKPAKLVKETILIKVFLVLVSAFFYTDYQSETARYWGFIFAKNGLILIFVMFMIRFMQGLVALRAVQLANKIPEHPVAKKILELGEVDD